MNKALRQAEKLIADESFTYKGNSLEVIEIVNAIKDGYRLVKPDEVMSELIEYYKDCIKDVAGKKRCEKCNEVCFTSILDIVGDGFKW